MNSQAIPANKEAYSAYDDTSFESQNRQGSSGPADLPADKSRGHNFTPFIVEDRDFHITHLPQTPLELFQLFIPISLIYRWIDYTNSWVGHLIENGVTDSWNTPISPSSRILGWEGLSSSQVYIWLGVLIYLGVNLGVNSPFHMITKFMPLRKFELIHRYLRPFDYIKINETESYDLPKVFQAAEEWSQHIQHMSALLFQPGSSLAVDECMIRYTGRSKETTLVKNKPTPLGLKIWIIAQEGFFIYWLWHVKGAKYGLSDAKKTRKAQGVTKDLNLLSNTQRVVISLCDMLPLGTYHVFVDNLFSSAALFKRLRDHNYGATGTARPNCGIHRELKQAKERNKAGKSGFEFNKIKVIITADNLVGSFD
ncbi:PiggyBac transposable element-derived protein 2 [Fusarium oxysporum f. sp. cubense race 1]|uniref:PiggyBac transposable element-derived protein 2 n=1 Tax=Fusarium oxysporum f. sp. cubense (strain race 1) TaxID=1229664 RepID=N4U0K0_FUSC1|nr:PiggyBac transposable element-derived protein 2 [Fusarium oxysporum f. sp. cubense race 1]